MRMFTEIFLVLCIIAQPQLCIPPQPRNGEIPAEPVTVYHKSSIFSLISNAGNCTAYENLTLVQTFRQLEEYCERPLPDTPHAKEFVSYEAVLCMVLYNAVQHFCKVGHQEVTKDIQNYSGFSCDDMIKVPDTVDENTKQWITLFKAKLGNIPDCERVCIQGKMISPVCEYIWKTNTLTHQVQVSSAASADVSPAENSHMNSKVHGKTNKTVTSKDRPLEAKTLDPSSTADLGHNILNSGSQNTEHAGHMMTPINTYTVQKDVSPAAANGNSTQSDSTNDVKSNVKEKAQATVNKGHNDAKKQAHTAGNNTQNDINKQVHGTNSNVQNIVKKQEHATNSSNQSAEVTPPNAPASVHTERISNAGKHDDSTGKSISSESKSNTVRQPENKSSGGGYASPTYTEDRIADNEDLFLTTVENTDDVQHTDEADITQNDDEEDGQNTDAVEQSAQTPPQIETHKEEVETGSTVQFNQLGDAADSHFYAYFMTMVVICIIGYLVFHNKQKILALALEGRSRRGTRRRPNTSAYRKLDSNLEEAVTSTGSTSVTHVIY